MRISFYSSKRERCGISTYTDHLSMALVKLGHQVSYYKCQQPFEDNFAPALKAKPDVFHFQHEPSIMPPDPVSVKFADELRRGGTKVFITLHTENSSTVKSSREIVSNPKAVIMHRPSLMIDATVIPMPCPSSDVAMDKQRLRQKYGYPEKGLIVSTIGFLIPWKAHSQIVEHMVPWLQLNPLAHLQVIASAHFNKDLVGIAKDETALIDVQARAVGKRRIQHISHYPNDQEVLERLFISDVGYVWCPMHTGSSSAAAALFTTARCPLVATTSTHYAYLGDDNIVRASKDNMNAFLATLKNVAANPEQLASLREAQERIYRERNYLATAAKHVELYGRETA
jgi:hypothetical protein